jgi:ketosteroid isomerase-like protein
MNPLLIALAAILLSQTPAPAPQNVAVMAPLHQFIDGFNKGDTKSALGACAEQTSIIDEFPPHEWHGAGACAKWAADYDADEKKNGVTEGVVTLTGTRHLAVTGDRAYVVALVNYAYKLKGKPMKETGSTLTVALQKTAGGWRMTAWTWSKN